jgi:hypothetical protein
MSRLAVLLFISLIAFPMWGEGFGKIEEPGDFSLEQIETPQYSQTDDGLVLGGRESSVSFTVSGNQKVSNSVIFLFTQKYSLLFISRDFSENFNFSSQINFVKDVLILIGILRI